MSMSRFTPSPPSSSSSSLSHLITPSMLIQSRRPLKRKHVQILDDQYTVKLGPGVTEYEYKVLQILERLDILPTPRPIDFFTVEDCNVIVMSTLPGHEFGRVAFRMSSEERVRILLDLRGFMDSIDRLVGSIRTVPLDSISDLDGSRTLKFPLLDGFINRPVKPSSFVEIMSNSTPQTPTLIQLQRSILHTLVHPSKPTRFSHMDLHPGNILIQNGKISGILDWELCGWYNLTLESFSTLNNVRFSKELVSDYATAWEIPDDVVRAVRVSVGDLTQGAMEKRREERLMEAARNGSKGKMRRRRKNPDPVPVPVANDSQGLPIESAALVESGTQGILGSGRGKGNPVAVAHPSSRIVGSPMIEYARFTRKKY